MKKPWSPKPFEFDDKYRVTGTLNFDESRGVLLEARREVRKYEYIRSLSLTTVYMLRKNRNDIVQNLLDDLKNRLAGQNLFLDDDIYHELYVGSQEIVGKIISKSLESTAHLQIPSQLSPSP